MRACTVSPWQQHGVVLLVSLLVLLMLALIATTVARTNLLQMHMAGNDQARVAAMQHTLAVLDAVMDSGAGTELDGNVGRKFCGQTSTLQGCDARRIALAPGLEPPIGAVDFSVVRMAPLEARMPVMSEDKASSTVFYRVAKFEIRASYDGTDEGQGRVLAAQGVLVRMTR